jgi:hypothetical protein
MIVCLRVDRSPDLDNPDWPVGCVNTPPDYAQLSYGDWHTMAEARTKRGERQVWCKTCERWRWKTTPCDGTASAPRA